MFTKILLALALGVSCSASTPWTTRDTCLETACAAGITCEWAQMCSNASNGLVTCGIDAHILDANPPRRRINAYFIGWELAHPVISWVLPRPWRNVWQGATIAFEIAVHQHNAAVGCRIHF